MRNLKRALSLTLASVMLLGMMVVGSSAAAGYDDVSETDNVEAIEVLQAIEVMVGDERGFGPERPVNRAEMAVVMGKLLSLDYNYYSTSCPFNDVYDWAQGWVGACAANGIVSGRGEGVYDPGATVTAVEAASMLMRALGYFKYSNDYADGFEVSTVRQGTIIGIFDGVGSSATEPMTRNQVAQMVLNALQSAVVEPDGNTTTFLNPDGTVLATTGKVNYVSVTSNKTFASAISRTQATSVGSQNDGWIVELGERLYDGKLKLTDTTDDFGRPSRYWEYDTKGIGTYVKEELIRSEYTKKVTGRTLHDLLGKTTIDDYDLDVYIDGVDDPTINRYVFGKNSLVRNNDQAVGDTGNGVLTQVFVDPDEGANGLITISVINTYLAIADEDYDDRTDDVDITVYGIDEIAGHSKVFWKTATLSTSDNATKKTTDEKYPFKLELEDFPEIVDVKDNDAFLVTVADGKVQTIAKPEILSGTQITSFKQGSWVVTGGTQYDFADAAEYDNETLWAYTANGVVNLKDITYNVYLDKYGYAIGVKEVERIDNYVFITGVDTNTNNRYAVQADASGIFLDGTMSAMKIDMKAARDLNDGGKTANALMGKYEYDAKDPDGKLNLGAKGGSLVNKWFTYTVGDDGVYEVSLVGNWNDVVNGARAGQYRTFVQDSTDTVYDDPTDGVDKIESKSIALRGGPSSADAGANNPYYSVYGDDQSVYITAELNTIQDAHDTPATIVNVIGGVDNVTVGVDNASIEIWKHAEAMNNGDDNSLTVQYTSYGAYTLFDDDGDIIAAVVVGEDSGVVTNLVYTHESRIESETDNNAAGTRATVKGDYTWTRKVVSNGEEVLLTEVGSGLSQLKSMQANTWYVVKYNAKGEVKNVYPAWDGAPRYKGLVDNGAYTDEKTRKDDRYVNDIEELEQAIKENNMVLYEVGRFNDGTLGTPVGSVNFIDVKPSVDNHTFYVRTNTTTSLHQGFRVADDVKTVFIQTNNNEETTTFESGYSRLEKVIDRLHAKAETNRSRWANPDTYHYEISAVMENGKAVVVVIRDLNDAGAIIDGVTRNYELRLYGNLFTSPNTVTGASNAVVVVRSGNTEQEIAPTGIGTDAAYGNYTTYSIPANATVGITDYDIDNVDPAFVCDHNIRTGINLRYTSRSISFTMPTYDAWIDGARMIRDSDGNWSSPFTKNITGQVDRNAPSLANVNATFNTANAGTTIPGGADQSGKGVQVVISNNLGRAASTFKLVAGNTYKVTLGDPEYTTEAIKAVEVDGNVQISFNYILTGQDIRNGYVRIAKIEAVDETATEPTPETDVKVTVDKTGDTKKEVTVAVTPSPLKKGDTATVTVTAATGATYTIKINGENKTVAADGKYTVATTADTTELKVEVAVTPSPDNPNPPDPGTEGTQSFYAVKNSNGSYTLYNFGSTAPSESAVKEAIAAAAGEGVTAADVQIINDGAAVLVKGTSANIMEDDGTTASNVSTPEALAKITVGTKTLYAPAIAASTVKGLDASTNYLFKGTMVANAFSAAADTDGEATSVALNTASDKTYELVKALTLANKAPTSGGTGDIIQYNDGNNWVDFTDSTLKFQSTLPIRVKIAQANVTANVPILITANGKVYTVTPATKVDTYITLSDVPEVDAGTVTVAKDSTSGTVYLNGTQYKEGTKEYFKAGDLIPVAAGTDYVIGLCGAKCTDSMFMTVAGQRYYVIQGGNIANGRMNLNAAAAFTTQTNATVSKIAKNGVEDTTLTSTAYVAVGATVTVDAKVAYTVLESTLTGWKSENASSWVGADAGKWSFTMPAAGVAAADAIKVAYSLTAPTTSAVNTEIQKLETASTSTAIVVSGTGLSGKTLSASWKTGTTPIANVTIGTPESISTTVSIPVSVGTTAMANDATGTITLKVGDLVLDIAVEGSNA